MRLIALCIALGICSFSVAQNNSIEVYPWNPDANSDNTVGATDILSSLSVYGNYFTPAEIEINNITLSEYLNLLEASIDSIASQSGIGIDSIFVQDEQLVILLNGGVTQNFPLPAPTQNITYTSNNYAATTTPSWLLKLSGAEKFGPSLERAVAMGLIATEAELGNFISLYPEVLLEESWDWGVQFVLDEAGVLNLDLNGEVISYNLNTALDLIPHNLNQNQTTWLSSPNDENIGLTISSEIQSNAYQAWEGPNSGILPEGHVESVSVSCFEDDFFDFSFSHFHPTNFLRNTNFENCDLQNTSWHLPTVNPYWVDIDVSLNNSDLSFSNFYWPSSSGAASSPPEITNCNLQNSKWFEPKMDEIHVYFSDLSNATFYSPVDWYNWSSGSNVWTNAVFICVDEYALDYLPADWTSLQMNDCPGAGTKYKVIAN